MKRLNASERVARLLAIIPWVASQSGAHLEEIAERFDYPRKHLEADLLEVVGMVGVYPFTPDTQIEVVLDDDRVWIHYADWFARPLRLSSEQAMSLLAAGESVLELSGEESGPLLGGLTKLGAALGIDKGLEIRLGSAPEETLDLLRSAITDNRVMQITYYTYGRDESTTRAIEPARVFADGGEWYVSAHCRQANDERVFRIDRIARSDVARRTLRKPRQRRHRVVLRPRRRPRIQLALSSDAAWVIHQYPHEGVEETADGGYIVTLAITAVPWLERLLVRLGPAAQIVEAAPGIPVDLVRASASRVLARYQ